MTWKSPCSFALSWLLAASLCLPNLAGDDETSLPKLITFKQPQYGWVAAELLEIDGDHIVFKDSGQTMEQYFNRPIISESYPTLIEKLRKTEKERGRMKDQSDCIDLIRVNEFFPPTSFRQILKEGYVFGLMGLMGDLVPGFVFADFPAGALEVTALETIVPQGNETVFQQNKFYIHYPNIHFEVDGFPFCSEGAFFDFKASPGKRFFAFINAAYDDDGYYFRVNPQYVFTETEHGELVKPRTLADDPDLAGIQSLDDLFNLAAQMIYKVD